MTRIVFIIYQVRKNKRFYKRLLATCKNTTNTKSELKTADTHKKKTKWSNINDTFTNVLI